MASLEESNTAHIIIEVGQAVQAILTIEGYDEAANAAGRGWLVPFNNDDDNKNGVEDYIWSWRVPSRTKTTCS